MPTKDLIPKTALCEPPFMRLNKYFSVDRASTRLYMTSFVVNGMGIRQNAEEMHASVTRDKISHMDTRVDILRLKR